MTTGALRVRFAPSPTGSLHLGNARTALFNWLLARRSGGSMILRIEDTDEAREREGSEASIIEDLRWLGLDWDEGPEVGGDAGPYRQSERLPRYRAAAEELLEAGTAYPCFCTDAELDTEREARRAAGDQPHYSGRCEPIPPEQARRRRASGEACAVRLRVRAVGAQEPIVLVRDRIHGSVEFLLAEIGDPVILRRDGTPTYNFAVVVDDAAMRISLVLRGDDHLSNTPRQLLLYRALGHAVPEFAHLPMVRGPDGERLSKRHGATSVGECRQRGYPPAAVCNALALLGWSPGDERTVLRLDEMIEAFDLGRVGRSAAVFDPAKLDWLSGQHIRSMAVAEVAAEAGRRLIAAGRIPDDAPVRAEKWLLGVAAMLQESIDRFDQAVDRCAGLFASPRSHAEAPALAEAGARRAVALFAALAAREAPIDREAWKRLAMRVREDSGLKGRALFLPIRLALTGKADGPELDHLVPLIAEGSRLFPERVASLEARARAALGSEP